MSNLLVLVLVVTLFTVCLVSASDDCDEGKVSLCNTNLKDCESKVVNVGDEMRNMMQVYKKKKECKELHKVCIDKLCKPQVDGNQLLTRLRKTVKSIWS